MVRSIGMKLSRVVRLVLGNFWVHSIPAQSLWGRPWSCTQAFCQKSIFSTVFDATVMCYTILESI